MWPFAVGLGCGVIWVGDAQGVVVVKTLQFGHILSATSSIQLVGTH
jgi:hypothetical protein